MESGSWQAVHMNMPPCNSNNQVTIGFPVTVKVACSRITGIAW